MTGSACWLLSRRRLITAAVVVFTGAVVSSAGATQPAGGGETGTGSSDLKARVESQRFYYAGEPVLVRVTLSNEGKAAYDNSKGFDLLGSVVVSQAGSASLKHKNAPAADPRVQPATILPGAYFGIVGDLREVVEGLDKAGRYSALFKSPGIETEPVPLLVIPRYDPSAAYQATLETDYGRLVFDLFGGSAPKHVQNFHDLANTGYYDGALLHTVVKGLEIEGGDTKGDGTSTPGYDLPMEIDPNLGQHRGTLSMLRGRNSDHGAQFIISLSENPAAAGKLSVFGALASGEDALTAIESLPTSGRKEYPPYRPLKEVRIRTLTVAPAPQGSKSTPAPAATKEPSKP